MQHGEVDYFHKFDPVHSHKHRFEAMPLQSHIYSLMLHNAVVFALLH